MSADELAIVSTKLDILIDDFQRLKKEQGRKLEEIFNHNVSEDKAQSRIQETIQWHSVIGGALITVLTAFNSFLYLRVEDILSHQKEVSATDKYYKDNRKVIIEVIERYKLKHNIGE